MRLLLLLLFFLCSCAPPLEDEKDDPRVRNEVPQTVPPGPPVDVPTRPAPPRARANPPVPEAELPIAVGGGVMSVYRCYEGDPDSHLTLTVAIKKEKTGWFRKWGLFLYECQGSTGCHFMYGLRRVKHGPQDDGFSCWENPRDQEIFSLCPAEVSEPVDTFRGKLRPYTSVMQGLTSTLYCDPHLPQP